MTTQADVQALADQLGATNAQLSTVVGELTTQNAAKDAQIAALQAQLASVPTATELDLTPIHDAVNVTTNDVAAAAALVTPPAPPA